MRALVFTTLFIGSLFGWDSAPRQAKEKFANSEFSAAAALFESAFDDYPRQKASLEFNIAQCWGKLDSMPRAINWYARAAENKLNDEVASLAWNNLGGLWASEKSPQPMPGADPSAAGASAQGSDPLQAELDKVNRSLEAFKKSLRKMPDNDFARYNYELLKRKQQQLQQQQQNQQQNKDEEKQEEQQKEEKDDSQQNKSQDQQKSKKNTENKGNQQQGEEGEEEKISMEEARQLLQAMKDNEKRFLQQLEKSKKHRKSNQDGPDW